MAECTVTADADALTVPPHREEYDEDGGEVAAVLESTEGRV
jgi:hypothetical protein